jgi:hypothetical protein
VSLGDGLLVIGVGLDEAVETQATASRTNSVISQHAPPNSTEWRNFAPQVHSMIQAPSENYVIIMRDLSKLELLKLSASTSGSQHGARRPRQLSNLKSPALAEHPAGLGQVEAQAT